ncbi:molybdate ABC transporter substrate-binding protein [Polynucleobacter sinensis]|uniref:molybdate ABC transporter substrate-binding protein n=1 Tax=Polynucleobacter sinensis TaxID=1743157 RepID=UPI00078676CE|nr:molybdate ABC transporter substrate-binding protein [Polynucleobacter sinensis]
MKLLKYCLGMMLTVQVSISCGQTTSIAVAANMKDAFAEIYTEFRVTKKSDLRVIYGSSGNFAAQILNGAPFSLFISADEYFPLELYKSGKTIDEGKVYAFGKIALITKSSSGIQLSNSKVDLEGAIKKANKIAIAKPDLAPYGKAAIEYMKAEGLWTLAKDKLVYGDNIGAATMFVASGAADLGFTAISLAKSPQIAKETSFIPLDDRLYAPIKQRMVLIKGAPQGAIALYQFMQSEKARGILIKHGYEVLR